jgi:hypothetical protein
MGNSLSLFLGQTEPILKKFSGTVDHGTVQNFLIEMCFRSYDVLVAIETLELVGLKQNDLEHPVGILLRSSLYDFINFQYIANSTIENQKIDRTLFEKLVKEHLSTHFNNIKDSFELKDELKHLDRFSEFGKKKIFKTLGILKEGKEFAKSKKINYLQEAIGIWEWYSKYEHYGAFTHLMYQEQEENHLRKLTAIQLIMANIHLSLCTLSDFGSDLFDLNELTPMENIILNYKNKC